MCWNRFSIAMVDTHWGTRSYFSMCVQFSHLVLSSPSALAATSYHDVIGADPDCHISTMQHTVYLVQSTWDDFERSEMERSGAARTLLPVRRPSALFVEQLLRSNNVVCSYGDLLLKVIGKISAVHCNW